MKKAAVVVAALLFGLFMAGGTAMAQVQSTGSAPAASPDHRKVYLRIMAFAHAPVAGAEVRLSIPGPHGWPLLDIHGATNQYGVSAVAVSWLPSLVRVTVSGGTISGQPFPGHLSADIALTDPANQIVVVNPVTTLVSRLLDARPDLDLKGAEARVRSFLTLPANYPLGLALRQGPHYNSRFFSPAIFVAEAEAAGGLDAFARLLLQELASGLTHSFRPPPLWQSTTSTATNLLGSTESDAISIAQAGIEAGVLDYASNAGVGNLAGWAMATGGSLIFGSSSSDVAAVEQAIEALTSAIDNLEYEVTQLNNVVQSSATRTQYDDITNFTTQYAVPIQKHENDLEYYTKACPPITPDMTPPPTPDSSCPTLYGNLLSELQTEDQGAYYELVQNYVQDNGTLGTSGMLHLYSLWLAETRAFFRPADSTKMQSLHDYWDSILTSAANLRMEYYHEEGLQNGSAGRGALTGFMGDPTQNPPTTGTFQANEAANQKLMGAAVPVGTVVSTVDGTMWSLLPFQPDPENPGFVYPGGGCFNTTFPDAYVQKRLYSGFIFLYEGRDQPTVLPPSMSQWQAAVKNAPPLSSGTNWQQWLTAQTKTTGDETPTSDGWSNSLSCTNPPVAIWTNDATSGGFWVIHLDHDNFSVAAVGNGAHNIEWPARTPASGEFYFWAQ